VMPNYEENTVDNTEKITDDTIYEENNEYEVKDEAITTSATTVPIL
jgi:hypothetical protein